MVNDQSGERIKILQSLLNAITSIYTLARERGVMTARFLNAEISKKNVTPQSVGSVISGHIYGGITRVGTELKRKILDKFVVGLVMETPLLVIVIGDRSVSSPHCSPCRTESHPYIGRRRIKHSLRRRSQELPSRDRKRRRSGQRT